MGAALARGVQPYAHEGVVQAVIGNVTAAQHTDGQVEQLPGLLPVERLESAFVVACAGFQGAFVIELAICRGASVGLKNPHAAYTRQAGRWIMHR